MPLFHGHGPDCARKVFLFAILLIAVISAITSLVYVIGGGLFISIGIIVVGGILLRFAVDRYADKVFIDPKKKLTEEEKRDFLQKTPTSH